MSDVINTYNDRKRSIPELVRMIQPGMHAYIHSNAGIPIEILTAFKEYALHEEGAHLRDLTFTHLLTLGPLPYLCAELKERVRHNSLFAAANCRNAINKGMADWNPIHLSDVHRLIDDSGSRRDARMHIDVALIQVSPPDEHGFCSLGVATEILPTVLRKADLVIAEVNPRMPRALGECFVHISRIDALAEVDHELPELPRAEITEQHMACGAHVAGLIEDGDCLQTGIGGLPDAVLGLVKDRRALGMHSELFSDGVVELVEAGVITGERKNLHPGKVVAGFVIGSQRVYEFVNDNPLIEMQPQNYVNDPFVIAQNENMVAINSALQIDLTGQVVADSMGPQIVSGFGGQVDFMRGAARAKRGRPVIAMPATAKGGTLSRIVAQHPQGYAVTTSRADVRWVATEHGIVNLFGLNIRQRAKALIELADPQFREGLQEEAIKLGLL
ncbi:acetyl-CoA hydrolase/transferase family protein [bacterium]|nr:acetyl-CoA hydrolase/transferase family protein [bacterium]